VKLHLLWDDGAVVYLNGQEIVRSNMPSAEINYRTLASSVVEVPGESVFHEFDIDIGLLRQGNNVLAVEIHQANTSSTDISFDLSLSGGKFQASGSRIYYTLDGTDPRQTGGAVSQSAILYDGVPFSLAESGDVTARSLEGGSWSAINVVSLGVDLPENTATPDAVDNAITVAQGGTATELDDGAASVLSNDSGLADVPILLVVETPPRHAKDFLLNTDGTFRYTHDGSENLNDSFAYRITDNDGQTAAATVGITITKSVTPGDLNDDGYRR
jgi:hypothetical protein